MKQSSKIITLIVASLFIFLLILNSHYIFYFQGIVVEGLKLKPEGTQEPGTSPYLDSQIYLFNPLTQIFKPISPKNLNADEPTWSPNGKFLAYSYARDSKITGIAIVENYRQVEYFDFPVEVSGSGFELTWSPDSQSILFLTVYHDCYQFNLLDVNDGSFKVIEGIRNICQEVSPNIAWLLDGTIVVEIDFEIYILDTANQSLIFITEGYQPFSNPKESWITYICKVPGRLGYVSLCEIMISGENKKVLYQFVDSLSISWTLGSKYVGFISAGGEGDPTNITVLDMRTKEIHNIYRISGRGRNAIWINSIAWRP